MARFADRRGGVAHAEPTTKRAAVHLDRHARKVLRARMFRALAGFLSYGQIAAAFGGAYAPETVRDHLGWLRDQARLGRDELPWDGPDDGAD